MFSTALHLHIHPILNPARTATSLLYTALKPRRYSTQFASCTDIVQQMKTMTQLVATCQACPVYAGTYPMSLQGLWELVSPMRGHVCFVEQLVLWKKLIVKQNNAWLSLFSLSNHLLTIFFIKKRGHSANFTHRENVKQSVAVESEVGFFSLKLHPLELFCGMNQGQEACVHERNLNATPNLQQETVWRKQILKLIKLELINLDPISVVYKLQWQSILNPLTCLTVIT